MGLHVLTFTPGPATPISYLCNAMKEYKRKQRRTDPIQRLGAGQYNFEYILNPLGEQARQEQDHAQEAQLRQEQSTLPLLSDDDDEPDLSQLPKPQDEEPPVDHHTFITWAIALVALVALFIATFLLAK